MSEPTTQSPPEPLTTAAPPTPPPGSAPDQTRDVAHDTEDRSEFLAHTIEEVPAADGAQVLENLPPPEAAHVAEYLDPETAAHVVAEMDHHAAAGVIAGMEVPEAAMVLAEMDPDDRVDVLEHIEPARREQLLSEMTATDAANVRALQRYPRDSAGGIMTTEVTALPEDVTVEQAVHELRRINEELEQMFYVYVVDRERHLVGVLSMRDLILARPERPIREIARRNVVSVPATTDQEDVARLMRKYKYLAVPVTDEKNRLLGLITVDDVVDVIQEEATEDVQKMAGAGAEERLTSPWHFSFRKRIWWLEVNLATAFAAAAVIAIFREVIEVVPILAAYQTIVSGMGGNASAQAMAVAIRGIALGEVDYSLLRRILLREFIVGFASGIVIGCTTAAIAIFFNWSNHAALLGLVIFLALVINHTIACVAGVAIPFIMKRLGFDPAQSATIFATTVTDCCGFFTTLGLAALFMQWLK